MQFTDKTFTFDRTVRLIIGALVLVALYLLTRRLSGVLLPFLISWIIAYLIHPIVCFFQYKCHLKSRIVSIVVTLVAIIGLLVGLVLAIAPTVGREFASLSTIVANYLNTVDTNSLIPVAVQEGFRDWLASLDFKSLMENGELLATVKELTPRLLGVVSSSLSFVIGLFVVAICFLYLVFILHDYEKLAESLPGMIPPRYRSGVMGLLTDLENGMNSYFRAQAVIASIVGVLFAIGFAIIGLPMAIVMGVILGIMNLVPYLQTVGLIPCALLCLLKSAQTGQNFWILLLELVIVVLVVQTTQDMLLTPKIMGDKMGLKPVVILLALSVWGSLLGFVGMIIALPMTTLMISYYKRFIIGEPDSAPAADSGRPLPDNDNQQQS